VRGKKEYLKGGDIDESLGTTSGNCSNRSSKRNYWRRL